MPTLSADVEVSILHTMKISAETEDLSASVLLYWSLFMFCCNYPLTNVVAGPDRIRKIKTPSTTLDSAFIAKQSNNFLI